MSRFSRFFVCMLSKSFIPSCSYTTHFFSRIDRERSLALALSSLPSPFPFFPPKMRYFKLMKFARFSTFSSSLPLPPFFNFDMSSMQTSTPAASTVSKEKPWHAAFPAPLSSLENGTLSSITVSQLQEKVKAQRDLSKRDFLVVDVRRTDFEVRSFLCEAFFSSSHSLALCIIADFLASRNPGCVHSRSCQSTGSIILRHA